MLNQQQLRELLDYDPEMGTWRWRKRGRGRRQDRVGSVDDINGYRLISIQYEKMRSARLAWLYMTGEWPPNDVDHIDGDRANDKWVNLRLATRSENIMNSKTRVTNTSGARGVSWDQQTQKWHVRVAVNGRQHHIGYFADFDKAVAARDERARVLHGAFARLNNTDEGVRQ